MITLALATFGWYVIYAARGVELEYNAIDTMATKTTTYETTRIALPQNDSPLYIPDLALFSLNNPWMYVSRTAPLPKTYQPTDLVDVTLPHAASDQPMKLQSRTNAKLTELFTAAEQDGRSLMVASAYRSIEDQQKLYDDFVEKRGETAARQYVALPGTSEHHSGLAVDIDDASNACRQDSDKCELSYQSIAWIAEHAPEYGFIVRFPETKQPVTGTAYEPWHLRYVGVVLARQLTDSGLAFDEFIDQVAPGRNNREQE
jgi:D-alanyl-D-alanine carboxypeptidase